MKKLDGLVNQFLTTLYKKQGSVMSEIIINWPKIVGSNLNENTRPAQIKSQIYRGQKINILYVNVTDSSIAMETSYLESTILERIAVFLGKRTIQRITIRVISKVNEYV
jgi:hypothetical protein